MEIKKFITTFTVFRYLRYLTFGFVTCLLVWTSLLAGFNISAGNINDVIMYLILSGFNLYSFVNVGRTLKSGDQLYRYAVDLSQTPDIGYGEFIKKVRERAAELQGASKKELMP